MKHPSNTLESNHTTGFWERVVTFGRMIKFSHTVFALPFALAAVVLAQRHHPLTGQHLFWLLVAMVGARSAAMGFNRIVDADIDLKNPRTAGREIPSGKLSKKSAILFVVFFSGLFILAAAMFGKLCLILSGPVLLLLFSYSYSKRFTALCHLYLGLTISLAPIGAWIAVTGGFSPSILLLSFALMTYIAGFDILYACQDEAFDRKEGLSSIPVRIGISRALKTAAILHVGAMAFFISIYTVFDMGGTYLSAVGIIGALMFVEHWLVKPNDLSRLNIAFFHMNTLISITLFIGVFLDELFRTQL
jgi:4-hydroxybenzoate polyprenyltransferase